MNQSEEHLVPQRGFEAVSADGKKLNGGSS